jgi:sugar lactone lactonase YvrE
MHDSCWAIAVGSDDRVYIGACCEGTGGYTACLYRYDPRRRRVDALADMADVTGEPANTGKAPQGKIHFSLCPSPDGKLYGATHCTTPPVGERFWNPLAMWGDRQRGFPGAHLWVMDLKTERLTDFGVVMPNEGIPLLTLDAGRRRLYGATYPRAHFFTCDLNGRHLRDKGRLSCWYPLAFCFDRAGLLYTSDNRGRLIRYDPATDTLTHLPATVPCPVPGHERMWMCDAALGPDGKIYGGSYSFPSVFRYDPEAERMEDLGPGLGGDDTRGDCKGLVFGNDGRLYYGVRSSDGMVVMRMDPRTLEKENLGVLAVDGARLSFWRAVRDSAGTLYLATVGHRPTGVVVFRPPP